MTIAGPKDIADQYSFMLARAIAATRRRNSLHLSIKLCVPGRPARIFYIIGRPA